jgi:hypothetical protein
MGKTAFVHFAPLRNCLANLPLALHGPLAQRGIVSLRLPVRYSHGALTIESAPYRPRKVSQSSSRSNMKGGRLKSSSAGPASLPLSQRLP